MLYPGAAGFASARMIHPGCSSQDNQALIQAQPEVCGADNMINKTDYNVHRLREAILKSLTEHEKSVLVSLPADKRRALIKKYVEVSVLKLATCVS